MNGRLDPLATRGSPLSTIWGDPTFNNAIYSGPNTTDNLPGEEEDASSTLNEDFGLTPEIGTEAIESGEAVAGVLSGIEDSIDPLAIIGQGIQAGANIMSNISESNTLAQGRSDFINSEVNGHGIGYQAVAQQNFNNVQNSVQQHQGLNMALNFLGPLGSAISAFISPSAFEGPAQTSFMAQTTSGSEVDAQSEDIINTT